MTTTTTTVPGTRFDALAVTNEQWQAMLEAQPCYTQAAAHRPWCTRGLCNITLGDNPADAVITHIGIHEVTVGNETTRFTVESECSVLTGREASRVYFESSLYGSAVTMRAIQEAHAYINALPDTTLEPFTARWTDFDVERVRVEKIRRCGGEHIDTVSLSDHEPQDLANVTNPRARAYLLAMSGAVEALTHRPWCTSGACVVDDVCSVWEPSARHVGRYRFTDSEGVQWAATVTERQYLDDRPGRESVQDVHIKALSDDEGELFAGAPSAPSLSALEALSGLFSYAQHRDRRRVLNGCDERVQTVTGGDQAARVLP